MRISKKYHCSKEVNINNKLFCLGKSTISKSVRLPEIVYDIINDVDGDSFSDKLIRLVVEYKLLKDENLFN